MTGGTLVIGLLHGLTVGLLAVGLVLVYKANRFLNLAHAQLGALPAALLGKAVLEWDTPFWVAFVGAVVLGSGTALVAERLVIAPVRARSDSPLRLLLLTVGLSQLLLALAFVPWFTPDPTTRLPYPQPFTASVEAGGVILHGMDVLTVLLVPVLVAALGAFLKLSSLGKQIRAAAANPDAARTCGVSVRRASALTWGLAGALATVSAVLAAPGQATFQAAALGPGLLLVTLGAAALGAFVSLPAAMAGGLAIGIVGQVVTAETSSAGTGQLAVFLLILGFIVVRAKAISKVFAHAGAPVAERAITRVPEAVRNHLLVRHQRRLVVGAGLAIAVVAPFLPGLSSDADRFKLAQVVVFCLVGVSLTMLLGWAGQISLGHGFVVGVGAFVTARLVPHGLSVPVLLAVAAVVGAALLTVTGLPALRVPGFTLSVVTLGMAVVGPAWLFHQEWFGTDRPNQVAFDAPVLPRGLGAISDQLGTYYLALVVLAVGLAAASALRRSVPGRLVVAVRDNEDAVATYGVAPASVKLAILATSGAFAACGGVLWATTYRLANEGHFTPDLSIAILAIPVIGGVGSLSGSVASAVMLYGSTFFLTPHLAGLLGDFAQNAGVVLFLAGFGLVTTIMWVPSGLAGATQNLWQKWLNRTATRAEDPETVSPPAVVGVGGAPSIDDAVVPSTVPARGDDGRPGSGLVVRQIDRLIGPPADGLGDMPLAVDAVHLRFGGIAALDGASLQVRPGEIVGLIGPNGAGKTTLMNVVSGMLSADTGSVKLFGHEVADLAPDLRSGFGLARSFQHAALFGELTVRETIQVAVSRRWMVRFLPAMVSAPWSRFAEAATEAEAADIVERFGLTPWRDTLCGQLSTGSRRICDLAAQVASRPKLMLLDEPTGGVAQREAEAFGPLVRRIRDELGCSILVVEHDMPLLMGLCDRVYAMESGRVITEGTPEQVRNDPRVIATYLGTDDVSIARSGRELEGNPA